MKTFSMLKGMKFEVYCSCGDNYLEIPIKIPKELRVMEFASDNKRGWALGVRVSERSAKNILRKHLESAVKEMARHPVDWQSENDSCCWTG